MPLNSQIFRQNWAKIALNSRKFVNIDLMILGPQIVKFVDTTPGAQVMLSAHKSFFINNTL